MFGVSFGDPSTAPAACTNPCYEPGSTTRTFEGTYLNVIFNDWNCHLIHHQDGSACFWDRPSTAILFLLLLLDLILVGNFLARDNEGPFAPQMRRRQQQQEGAGGMLIAAVNQHHRAPPQQEQQRQDEEHLLSTIHEISNHVVVSRRTTLRCPACRIEHQDCLTRTGHDASSNVRLRPCCCRQGFCNALFRFQHLPKLSHGARIVFVGYCICCRCSQVMPEETPMVALVCGHLICQKDFESIGGVIEGDGHCP